MTWQTAVMYAVAAILGVAGTVALLALTRPGGPAKVYVFRMAGIMALAAAVVLAMGATAMWRWSAAP